METTTLIICLALIFGAAIVRGFTGFGFSALSIASLSFFLPIKVVVPVVLMMEVLASLSLLRGVWDDVDWRWLLMTCIGLIIGTPIGAAMLRYLPNETTQLVLYVTIMILAVLLLLQQMQVIPKFTAPDWLVGIPGGIANGLAGLLGLVVSLFLLSSGRKAAVMRASLIVLFFFSDIYAVGVNAVQGLIGRQQFVLLGYFLVPLFLGVTVGAWIFRKSGEKNYKTSAIALVLFVAVMGIGRVVLG